MSSPLRHDGPLEPTRARALHKLAGTVFGFDRTNHWQARHSADRRWFEGVDQKLILEVSDRGEGIAPEHLPRLTERFYRVDKSRSQQTGGTGLGLAIVKHVAAAHQAELQIESELEKGSTFRLVFADAAVTSV